MKIKSEKSFYGIFSAGKNDGMNPAAYAKALVVTSFLIAARDNDPEYGRRTEVDCTTGGHHGVFEDREEATNAAREKREYSGKDRWGATVTRYGVIKCNRYGQAQCSAADFANPKCLLPRIGEDEATVLLDPANVEKAIELYNATIE